MVASQLGELHSVFYCPEGLVVASKYVGVLPSNQTGFTER
jgi:hypothetical protein